MSRQVTCALLIQISLEVPLCVDKVQCKHTNKISQARRLCQAAPEQRGRICSTSYMLHRGASPVACQQAYSRQCRHCHCR